MKKNCGNCANYDRSKMEHTDVCGTCISGYEHGERFGPTNWKALPMTNADRIRAMSDEELCEFMMTAPPCDEKISAMMRENGCTECEKCVMDWLRQPAEA